MVTPQCLSHSKGVPAGKVTWGHKQNSHTNQIKTVTPSLPWRHLKKTSNSGKFQTFKPFCCLCCTGVWKDNDENAKRWNKCYRTRKYTVCRHFSPNFFQALAVKGLTTTAVGRWKTSRTHSSMFSLVAQAKSLPASAASHVVVHICIKQASSSVKSHCIACRTDPWDVCLVIAPFVCLGPI